jgi:FSR family fosmidomycin resistance protein-like MFS transporter
MGVQRRATVLLAAGHGSVDIYQGIVPVLVPFLVAQRHYDYLAVSGFVLAATVLSSVVQPVFGLLTDRWRMRWLIPVSMLTSGLGVAGVGMASSYPATCLAVALSGLGVAAYHPEGARLARSVTGGGHVEMSWFSVGGNIGFALAPVIATPVVAIGGLAATPWLLAPALLGALLTVPMLVPLTLLSVPMLVPLTLLSVPPRVPLTLLSVPPRGRGSRGIAATAKPVPTGRDDWPAFRTLTAIVALRAVAYTGISTFLGLFVQQRIPHGAAASGIGLFALYAGGVAGSLLGGRCAVRWGRLPTLRIAYLAASVAMLGVVFVPGPAVLICIGAAALALYVPFSLHITLGQDYLPNRIGTASGVTLGLAVSVGGVFAPALGALAKATSLQVTLGCLVVLPVLAALLAGRLREPSAESSPRPSASPDQQVGDRVGQPADRPR